MPVSFAASLAVLLAAGTELVWQGAGVWNAAWQDAATVHSEQQVSAAIARRAERTAVTNPGRLDAAHAEVDSTVAQLDSFPATPTGVAAEVASGPSSLFAGTGPRQGRGATVLDHVATTAPGEALAAYPAARPSGALGARDKLAAVARRIVVLRHLGASGRSLRRATLDSARNSTLDLARSEPPETVPAAREGRVGDGQRPRFSAFPVAELGELVTVFERAGEQALSASAEQVRTCAVDAEVSESMTRRAQSPVRHQPRLVGQFERNDVPSEGPRRIGRLARRRGTDENVLVLSGTEPVRVGAEPVALAEVFTAALSEISQYQRVFLLVSPEVMIAGVVAGDLVRILAELLDNATSFFPAEHDVIVQAQILRDGGLSMVSSDNGIGRPDEEVLGTNERLRNPGSLEPARSARVALRVVRQTCRKASDRSGTTGRGCLLRDHGGGLGDLRTGARRPRRRAGRGGEAVRCDHGVGVPRLRRGDHGIRDGSRVGGPGPASWNPEIRTTVIARALRRMK